MNKKYKVLVTGASGLLGRSVMRVFNNYENLLPVGLAYSRTSGNLIKCDLTKPDEIRSIFEEHHPNYVIHAAAERYPDRIEKDPDGAELLNVSSSTTIASLSNEFGSKLIYISTDYVFDGKNPPYKENDAAKPLNKYGKTKLAGEQVTLNENKDFCVLRIPILYGPVEYLEESAVTCLFKTLKSSTPCSVSDYEKRYPSFVDDISCILGDMISLHIRGNSISGIYHWGGLEQFTKYAMVVKMAEVFSLDYIHVTPDKEPTSDTLRPVNSQLENSRLLQLGIGNHTKFEDGIQKVLSSFLQ